MSVSIHISKLSYTIRKKQILREINIDISAGSFIALMGENGAGKTTLIDLLMGFRKPTKGLVKIKEVQPHLDPWKMRADIAYLSEKVDIPGDWTASEFLHFNRYFYENYSISHEEQLVDAFRIDLKNRIGNMSAGEIRRVQTVAALSMKPKIILVDEITAVLDIVGRKKFMNILWEQNQKHQCTILLATNILEDLVHYISHLALLQKGSLKLFQDLNSFLEDKRQDQFSQKVASLLESL